MRQSSVPASGPPRARLRLIAAPQDANATFAEFSFDIDPFVLSRLQPGDEIYFRRDHHGRAGISILRRGELVVAVGTIADVPLGRRVWAMRAHDLRAATEQLIQRRDAHFRLNRRLVEISIDGESVVMFEGLREVGAIGVVVPEVPVDGRFADADECAAIWHEPDCSRLAATTTATWLISTARIQLWSSSLRSDPWPKRVYSVRPATTQDSDTLALLREMMFKELGRHPEPGAPTFQQNASRAFVDAMNEGTCEAWLAISEHGEPVGCVALLLYPRLPSPESSAIREGYLLNVFTRPDWRRRGVADALVAASVARAKEHGLGRIRLHASDAGQYVYAKAGFQSRLDEMELRLPRA